MKVIKNKQQNWKRKKNGNRESRDRKEKLWMNKGIRRKGLNTQMNSKQRTENISIDEHT